MSVLYCDTDSVIYIQNVDETPNVRTGDYLGHLTDELEEFDAPSFNEEFVSDGPKNYAFYVFWPIDRRTYNQMQGKGYKVELKKFKSCKVHHIEGYDSERHRPRACT